jgi:hypothetical protein
MIFNDAIHVQVEEKGEDGNVESINTFDANDYMCVIQGHKQKV